MRLGAIAALALCAVVAGYLNAKAISALYWSSRLAKKGELVGELYIMHPVAASPEVVAMFFGIGLAATLGCCALAYRLRRHLGATLVFALPFVLMAATTALAGWVYISSPQF